MNPFTAPKNLSPFHFTCYYYFFTYSMNPSLHFTSLHFASPCYSYLQITSLHFTSLHLVIHIHNSLPFASLHFPSLFTFYQFHFPSMVFTSLTLVLKIYVLPLEVPVASSGSLFQSVMDLFKKEYFPMSILCFLALIFQ